MNPVRNFMVFLTGQKRLMKISNGARKKITILIIAVFVLLIIAGGLFWWWEKEETLEGLFELGILPKGFISEETSEGFILKNETMGVSFKVPKDWSYEGYLGDSITLKSPDYEYDTKLFKRIKGCYINTRIDSYSYSNRIERINQLKNGFIFSEDEEIIEISGYDALRKQEQNSNLLEKGIESMIEIEVPLPRNALNFFTAIFSEGGEGCVEVFEIFVKNVFIDYKFAELGNQSKKEDFVIIKNAIGSLVKNTRENFSFSVPNNWIAVTEGYKDEGKISFYTKDYLENLENNERKGCFMKISVNYKYEFLENLKKTIEENKLQKETFSEQEIIKIDNYQAIRTIMNYPEEGIKIVSAHMPVNDKLILFKGGFYSGYEEHCLEDFHNLLDGFVFIKN